MTIAILFKDIGLDQSLKKTVDFENKAKQLEWFNKKPQVVIQDIAYNKLQNSLHLPVGMEEVVKSFGDAQTYTYAIIRDLDTSDRDYFCFISSTELVDEQTVMVNLTVDPIQTYMAEFSIDECLVDRAHIDRWTKESTKPKRITPTKEGVTAFSQNVSSEKITGDNQMVCIAVSDLFPGSNIPKDVRYIVFPVKVDNPNFRYQATLHAEFNFGEAPPIDETTTLYYPSFAEVTDGTALSLLPIATESVISITVEKNCTIPLERESEGLDPSDVSYKGHKLEVIIDSKLKKGTWISKMTGMLGEAETAKGKERRVYQVINDEGFDLANPKKFKRYLPERPIDGADKNPKYEPAMFMNPFTEHKIVDGYGQEILDISDNIYFKGDDYELKTYVTGGGVNNVIKLGVIGDSVNSLGAVGAVANLPSAMIDLTSDAWKTYVLTQRDTDRQLVANENMRRSVDNILFTGYGGALVGSRSASGKDDPSGKHGGQSAQGIQKFKGLGGLASAVGLATGVGIATSVIDSHYAWEAQELKEKQIKNQPGIIKKCGDSIKGIKEGLSEYYIITNRVDDVNYNKAFERMFHYGYNLKEFMVPDLRSRKYFNYILTSGAVIKGSLNASIKTELAQIFDSGITIFHGDYCETLDYPIKENIERSLI